MSEIKTADLMVLYRKVEGVLLEVGYVLTPGYGTLLGTIRDHKRIPWDKDTGLDGLVLLNGKTPDEVKKEFAQLVNDLAKTRIFKTGLFYLKRNSKRAFIKRHDKSIVLDLQYAWYENDLLGLSFGWYGTRAANKQLYKCYKKTIYEGYDVLVPGNAEEVLAQTYGETWNIPDPQFKHDRSKRIIDKRYINKKGEIL